ncbi:hypothetical protein [Pollutibacter soli]|uniref:hypothetical protein n=1 Tax=Pollutibacter soli TaxID=3034157 RepID=UPI0030135A5D
MSLFNFNFSKPQAKPSIKPITGPVVKQKLDTVQPAEAKPEAKPTEQPIDINELLPLLYQVLVKIDKKLDTVSQNQDQMNQQMAAKFQVEKPKIVEPWPVEVEREKRERALEKSAAGMTIYLTNKKKKEEEFAARMDTRLKELREEFPNNPEHISAVMMREFAFNEGK